MTETNSRQPSYFVRLQQRIDLDDDFRATFKADPLAVIAGDGVSTEGLRVPAPTADENQEVTGHTYRIDHVLCRCLVRDTVDGSCLIEQCLI